MRVLVVTNLFPNPRQPHRASFNRRQFAALAEEHEVRVLAPIAWTIGRIAARSRISDGIAVQHPHYFYTPKVGRGWYGHFYEHSIRRAFNEQVHSFRPDVVLGCWAYPDGWAAARLAREAGVPVVIKVHGSDLLTVDGVRRVRTGEALRMADGVIAVSQNLRERAIELGADASRTHLVYNGINSAMFHPGPRDQARQAVGLSGSEPVILFVGNLLPVKGPDVLLDALDKLRQQGVAFRCVMIGQGPMRSALAAQANRLSLSEQVRFVGPCSQDSLADWYRAADLLVLPSRSEGTPNVLLEAGACGTPFIAANVGGVPDLCDPGVLVPPADPLSMAAQIRAALETPDRSRKCLRFIPGSWQDSARSLAGALQHTISNRWRQAA